MSSYTVFAKFYDRLTQNAEYKAGSEFISGFFNCESRENYKVLDIACGTGTVAKHLCDMGYDVWGLDLSEEMLSVASPKIGAKLYKRDMRFFDFENSFDSCICTLDSLNHLESKEDWRACFSSVYSSLKEGGLFIFDVNTVYKHNEVLADNSFIFDEEDFFLAWDNEPLGDNRVRIMLDFFIFNGVNYDRCSEEFTETAFEIEEIEELFCDKFELLGVYDNLSEEPPRADSERIFFVLKRK